MGENHFHYHCHCHRKMTIPQCWEAVEASAWQRREHKDRCRVLSLPIGLICKSKNNKISITFGLSVGVHGNACLIYAAGIHTWWEGRWRWKGWKWTWWEGRWMWKGWNWTWTPISACHVRICDQWGWNLADIQIQMFVLKEMYMTDKLITYEHNVQTSHADDGLCEWVTVWNEFSGTCICCSA